MAPLLQDDQDGYLRALGASETLTIHGESSGHVEYLTDLWFEFMCSLSYSVTRMVGYLRVLGASEITW